MYEHAQTVYGLRRLPPPHRLLGAWSTRGKVMFGR